MDIQELTRGGSPVERKEVDTPKLPLPSFPPSPIDGSPIGLVRSASQSISKKREENYSDPRLKRKGKFLYVYIMMRTDDVNHTALYKDAEKIGGKDGSFKSDTFQRCFYSSPKYGGKDRSSREHDEVISRALPVLGFSKTYYVERTKRTVTRYLVVYEKLKLTKTCKGDDELVDQATLKLQDFYKHYRRKVSTITVHESKRLPQGN